ncbi:MAG: hypothetical protein Ct9H300mP31_14240 [Acidimicrobiaceae bacterium]|nr:MAG: hypothetical protein Ct9H300mP31_14240 [Acidimicrobiaceae bacterium]
MFAFGLLTTFQGELFDGTRGLLELADERVEVQVEARCWCGSRATHNARLVDGVQVYDGKLFVIDDPNDERVAFRTALPAPLAVRPNWSGRRPGRGPRERSGLEAEPARQVV